MGMIMNLGMGTGMGLGIHGLDSSRVWIKLLNTF